MILPPIVAESLYNNDRNDNNDKAVLRLFLVCTAPNGNFVIFGDDSSGIL